MYLGVKLLDHLAALVFLEKFYALLMSILIYIPTNDMQLFFFSIYILMYYAACSWNLFIFFTLKFIKITSQETGVEVHMCNASTCMLRQGDHEFKDGLSTQRDPDGSEL